VIGSIIIAVTCLLHAPGVAGQIAAESDSSTLVLRIEVGRPTYAAGDSIKLRLSLRNTLPDRVTVPNGRLVDRVSVSVYDSAGNQLTPGPAAGPGFSSGPPTMSLGPWAQVIAKGSDGRDWIDLREWGYELRSAGRYSIVVTPRRHAGLPLGDMTKPLTITVVIRPGPG